MAAIQLNENVTFEYPIPIHFLCLFIYFFHVQGAHYILAHWPMYYHEWG